MEQRLQDSEWHNKMKDEEIKYLQFKVSMLQEQVCDSTRKFFVSEGLGNVFY